MRLSFALLSRLCDLSGIDARDVARELGRRTAEVESVLDVGGELDGVVVARVLAVAPHPQADRLRLCTVLPAEGAPTLEVVCGAPNVAAGQTVCFAPVGTRLPNGVVLDARKIRGVESRGMICAEDEMGLGTAHDGIVVLPADLAVGTPVSVALGLRDTVFEIANSAITNRPDLWSHEGFAREASAIFRRDVRLPEFAAARERVAGARGGAPFPVEIADAAGCRRYVALVIEDVVNGPSPAPVRRRLEALGLRSVDLLVDLTNLAMVETGQPLHAFDLAHVRGGRIVVRAARAGERLKTLDGRDRALDADDLVIADAQGPLALAGVLGGEGSGVVARTTGIVLESASFDAARVRRASIRHGLRTDASARFEKGLDPEAALRGALAFLDLVLTHVPGARVSRPITDLYPRPYPPASIDLDRDVVRARLGMDVPDARIDEILRSLGFTLGAGAQGTRVGVPTWRATKDVSGLEDLVEEVGRLHGYDDVRVEAPPRGGGGIAAAGVLPARRRERTGRAALSLDLGYAEIASYAFHGAIESERLLADPEALLRLANPLSAEQDRLQATCVQNLLRAAAKNLRAESPVRLCEWTRVFPVRDRAAKVAPAETPVVGLLTATTDATERTPGETFLAVKEDVLALLARMGAGAMRVVEAGDARLHPDLAPPAWLHPGRRAAIVRADDGEVVALVGEVHPRVLRAFGLESRAAVAEVNLARLPESPRPPSYVPPPRFPRAPFDVAVVVPRRTLAAEVEALLRFPGVVDVRLFDVYEGEGIPEGHRSLAFTVTFGSDDATLAPKEVATLQAKALGALRAAGFAVRSGETSS